MLVTMFSSLTIMEIYGRQKIKSEFKILGIYQLIGGILGLVLLFYSIYDTGIRAIPIFFLLLTISLFFVYSILCGILCLKSHDLALTLSFVNQLIQLLGIGLGGYLYNYVAGVYFSLKFDLTDLSNINLGFGISKMELQFNRDINFHILEINFIAIALIIWIDKLQRKIRNEQLKATTEQISTL